MKNEDDKIKLQRLEIYIKHCLKPEAVYDIEKLIQKTKADTLDNFEPLVYCPDCGNLTDFKGEVPTECVFEKDDDEYEKCGGKNVFVVYKRKELSSLKAFSNSKETVGKTLANNDGGDE